MRNTIFTAAMFALAVMAGGTAFAETERYAHGFSPLGSLAYGEGFSHFAYVNPQAPMGGTLRVGRTARFDSTNTLHYPGATPTDLRLIYESLVERAADEPASFYGLLAEGIRVAEDLSSVTFRINADARWHDGEPVTAGDVVFTFETLKAQGAPFYRQAFRSISATAENDHTVRFDNARPGDRDFVKTVGAFPVHPEHLWSGEAGTDVSSQTPVGSGPYRVASLEIGKQLVLERVVDQWARDMPVNRGRWNFERIEVRYYLDDSVALQAFMKGDLDVREETSARNWSSAYANAAVENGDIKLSSFDAVGSGRIQNLVFNLRRQAFQDRRVRQALAIAFDAEWVRDNLFSGLYQVPVSLYGDSELSAKGAADVTVRDLLTPHRANLPDGIFGADILQPATFADRRARNAEADRLLREAGFIVRDGRRIDPSTGKPFQIEVVTPNPQAGRVLSPYAEALERIGIELIVRSLEPVTAQRRMLDHDYDMTVLGWTPSPMPGRAENLLWHSALADQPGSYALAGTKDPALDAAIEAMGNARSMDALLPAARAFDRVMRAQQYVVPLWREQATWIAHVRALAYPDASVEPSVLDRWWFEDRRTN
ncbi:extracellular solute-binding protein [Tepidamorphus sp. 3E244]|uniref:extracellular solute-binding protein n=1 Tax=Tepidamorphus sp. 3E244 TaxID=3385498 RepID=UPI0038FC7D4C